MSSMAERVDSAARLSALRKLLIKEDASTQDELKLELEKLRFQVNQSTISRDLRKLGAIKLIDSSGRTVYRLAEDLGSRAIPQTSGSGLRDLVLSIEFSKSMVVLLTQPGSAPMVARILDARRKELGALGTIAGDDTVFVCPQLKSSPQSVATQIRALLV